MSVLGVSVVVTVFALVSGTSSYAADTNANVNIDNVAPTVSVVDRGSSVDGAWTPGDPITPVANSENILTINADITDLNGFANQTITVTAVSDLTASSGTVSDHGCTGNYNDCVPRTGPATCTTAESGATTRRYTCVVPMRYNGNPTAAGSQVQPGEDYVAERWDFIIRANDTVVNVDDKTSFFEYSELVAFQTFGGPNFDLGTTTTDGSETPDDASPGTQIGYTNKGNTEIDLTAQADKATDSAAWTCTGSGNPLISDFHLKGQNLPYASMDALTNNGSLLSIDSNLDRNIDANVAAGGIYTRFATTQAIDPGTCTLSAIAITAIKSL